LSNKVCNPYPFYFTESDLFCFHIVWVHEFSLPRLFYPVSKQQFVSIFLKMWFPKSSVRPCRIDMLLLLALYFPSLSLFPSPLLLSTNRDCVDYFWIASCLWSIKTRNFSTIFCSCSQFSSPHHNFFLIKCRTLSFSLINVNPSS
jgi:hypothetical protein